MKIKSIFNNLRLHEASLGYVLILVVIFIPIMLLATKYCLDLQTVQNEKVGRIVKKCAKEAALKVAQNWNPALSRDQQKESMLRLADEVYNASPAYNTTSLKYSAIPGLEMPTKINVSKGGSYDPLKVEVAETLSLSPSSKTIRYTEENVAVGRYMVGGVMLDLSCMIQSVFDAVYKFSNRDSRFVLEDTFRDFGEQYATYYTGSGNWCIRPKFIMYSSNLDELKKVSYNHSVAIQGEETSSKFQTRVNPNDTTVQVMVEGDKIKVQTDEDIGYAIPASCNVDIVLGIPVNGAASNVNNLDANSSTPGGPYIANSETPTADGMKTPIYQIAHALKEKLVTPLKYTRGVNVGIVPYCGMCSLPSNRMTNWSSEPENFVVTDFLADQNAYQAYIRSCFLYGITLLADGLAGHSSHYGIGAYSWTNIMARKGKITTEAIYGGNILHCGDLLSTDNPTEEETSKFSSKFMRRPINKIFVLPGAANFLSMNFDSGTTQRWTWANPYSIVELQSDLLKIGDLLNLFYPFCFNSNQLSNFIFIPVTWANNLFQSWSKDPKYDAVDTNKANTNTDQAGGRLSCPSKTTEGRKKALILVVNKPDWFEPGELTYLGYDNDFSEVPMIESDCIRFDTDYSDTTRKFADGTAYNGTIQGAKKILKFSSSDVTRNAASGWYECNGSGTLTLSFPKKYLLKVVVEPKPAIIWEKVVSDISATGLANNYCWNIGEMGIGPANGKENVMLLMNTHGTIASSEDGEHWEKFSGTNLAAEAWHNAPKYGVGVWCTVRNSYNTAWSINGVTWSHVSASNLVNSNCLAFGNGIFMTIAGNLDVYVSLNGKNWTKKGTIPQGDNGIHALAYGGGRWIAAAKVGSYYSTDDGENWTLCDTSLANIPGDANAWYGAPYVDGYFYVVNGNSRNVARSRNGLNWEYLGCISCSNPNHMTIGYYKDKFYVVNKNGCIHRGILGKQGTITFPYITSNGNSCTALGSHIITERKEFFIEADQINEGSDGNYQLSMKLDNIRLISAEITNRPYKKVTSTCTLSGTTSGSGTAYVTTNVKKPITLDAKAVPNEGTVTFSNINGTNVTNGSYGNDNLQITNGQVISFDKITKFNFPANCFGSNYEDKKIAYNTNNARIVNAKLANRHIRVYGTGQADNAAIKEEFSTDKYVNSNDISPFTLCVPFKNLTLVDGPCVSYTHSGVCKPYSFAVCLDDNIGKSTISWNYKAGYSFHIKLQNNGSGDFLFTSEFTGWKNQGQCTYPPASKTISGLSSSSSDPHFFITCTAAWVSGNNGTGCNYFYCYYSNDYTLNNGVTLQDNTICFDCCGDLSIDIEPIIRSSYLKHYSPNGNEVSDLVDANTTKTVTITPEEYKYEKQTDSNGNITYKITLNIENLQLSNAKMADTNKTVVYTKPRLPKMSRFLDFTKQNNDNFVYDINGITAYADNNYMRVGEFPNGEVGSFGVQWDTSLDCWKMFRNNNSDHAGWCHFFMMNTPGDMYMLADAREIPGNINSYYDIWTNPTNGSTVTHKFEYFGNNQYRSYWPFTTHRRVPVGTIFGYTFDTYMTELPLIYAGITLPVNAMLYCGASGSTLHANEWQSDASGAITTYNATDATKKVTKDACKKLKSDWKKNVRIYLIKYRKQLKYKHKTDTSQELEFDYSYLNDCAGQGESDGSENSSTFIYDATDETGLNDVLTQIASDIKKWAGYQAAKNVE